MTAAAAPGERSDGRSAYTAVAPCRLVDTLDVTSPPNSVDASTIRIQVTGRCGVDDLASAVAVSITVTNTRGDGYAVVTPAATRGPTSTINWADGETRAASTVVAVSQTGAVDVRVPTGLDAADVIVDITGAWALVAGPVRGGRLVSFPGRRVLDTRMAIGPAAAGQSITGLYGADALAAMRIEAATLAADLLAWADGWGADVRHVD